jgi:putative RNA 2'-phosphotransferase
MVKFHYVRDTMIRKCTEHGYFRGSSCLQCKRPGRYLLDDSKEEKLGRFVSGTLRHFPASAGVEMDRFGWVNLNAFCDVMRKRYSWMRKEYLYALVESDEKGRYEICNSRIRARYGHSVNIDLDYEESNFQYLYYGVSPEEVDVLLENGIFPIKQRYVHLSTSYEKAVEVALIHTESPIILQIDALKAQEDGISLKLATSYIVLAENIPSDYLFVVED